LAATAFLKKKAFGRERGEERGSEVQRRRTSPPLSRQRGRNSVNKQIDTTLLPHGLLSLLSPLSRKFSATILPHVSRNTGLTIDWELPVREHSFFLKLVCVARERDDVWWRTSSLCLQKRSKLECLPSFPRYFLPSFSSLSKNLVITYLSK
jgi:hypothetical protein